MNKSKIDRLKEEIISKIQVCSRCRMCVNMCPTYEGWFTQSAVGRLMAINLHFKHGQGSLQSLSKIVYSCASCRRCQDRCEMLSMGAGPADIILNTRQLLVEMTQK